MDIATHYVLSDKTERHLKRRVPDHFTLELELCPVLLRVDTVAVLELSMHAINHHSLDVIIPSLAIIISIIEGAKHNCTPDRTEHGIAANRVANQYNCKSHDHHIHIPPVLAYPSNL